MPSEILPSPNLSAYPDLRSLLGFWKKLGAGRPMPARLDLDPLALKCWLGNLLLVDVIGQDSFRYRVYGTRIASLLGHDFQGREVDALPPPHRAEALEDYRVVVSTCAPLFVERPRDLYREHLPAARAGMIGKLSLPLSADGRVVSQILVGIYARPPAE